MPITEGGRFSPVQQIVSPGVFTRENDLSGLAQGVANIGGAIVAPFAQGPAFFPTLIQDVPTLESKFGIADGVYYGPYTAKEYLQEQGIVTVVRVGGLTGYWQKNPLVIYAQPGEWQRNSDAGALTTASFLYLNSDNYIANIVYTHASTLYSITGSQNTTYSQAGGGADKSGSFTPSIADTNTLGTTATVTYPTNDAINSFISSINSLTYASDLSSSLAAAKTSRKLVSLTVSSIFPAFSASITKQATNSIVTGQVNKITEKGAGDGFALAWFDLKKWIPNGSIYFYSGSTQKKRFNSRTTKTIDTGVHGTVSSLYNANISSSYLSSSTEKSGGNVYFPFVFLTSAYPLNNSINTGSSNAPSSSIAFNNFNLVARYDSSTLRFSGSVAAKFGKKAATSNYDSTAVSGKGNLSGSVLYANKQVNIGIVNSGILHRVPTTGQIGFLLTSSYQGEVYTESEQINKAIAETTETVSLLSASLIPTVAVNLNKDNFDATGTVNIKSGSFKAVRGASTCGAGVQVLGVLNGEFGTFSTGVDAFEPDGSSIDPCNPSTTGRKNMVLAILANTQNGSTQFSNDFEVNGFKTSELYQLTSSNFPYKGYKSPSENNYQLELNYSFTNASSGETSTGTYGYYNFNLDESDNLYIKNVFGTDPTVGNPAKQISGQKVEAAYCYNIFEDSIKRFLAEKTRPNNEGGGWRLQASIAPAAGFTVGESIKFVDQYSTDLNAGDSQFSITNAYTPWIYSQKIAPFKGSATASSKPTKFKLFKVHTLGDGTITNTQYKIEISNVKLAGTVVGSDYGSFTLAVRAYSDTDKRPKYLEIYQNLNLDPDSANFIARRIGDRFSYITFAGKIIEFGTFITLSKYIRIEMTDISYPETCVPYGFESYSAPVDGTLSSFLPPVRYSKASIYGLGPGKYPSGTVFGEVPASDNEIASLYPTSSTNVGVENDTKQYFKPLPYYGSNDQNGDNIDFDLEDKTYGTTISKLYAAGTGSILDPSLSGSIPSNYDPVNESTYVKLRKFIVGFQGGFDGQWPAIPINVGSDITAGNTQGLDCTNIKSPGSVGYKQCIAALGNADEFDINLIVTPGIFREQHSYVTELVIDMCEARGDAFYIMDNVVFPASNQSVGLIDAAINSVATIDSNYVGTYYPWVKILDTNMNKIISVPPSVVLPAVYASSDNASAEWYAPAGLNRGGIITAVQVLDRLTHSERDTLYENRVNPIAAFPGQGICVWGQKTLQVAPSALDRINVRRLLINLKKFIASSSNYLVFEQNVAATRNRFLSIVNPYLESVQQRNGIYAFQVKMDDENNTPDLIDRNILYGQIFIQPAKTAEFIVLDFNILPTGAQFSA